METKDIRGVVYVEAREWFDRSGGNSYFAGRVFVNGLQVAVMPFQYGYGSQFEHQAVWELNANGFLPVGFDLSAPLWRLRDFGYVVHSVKYSATKADTKRFGEVA
jgi:hypothetical protein